MGRGQKNHSFKRGGHRGNHRGSNRGGRSFERNDQKNFTKKRFEHPVISDIDRMKTTKQLENAVGITQYISKAAGFTGVLKARFSDFQVNEVDLLGKEAILNNFTVPKASDFKAEATEGQTTDLKTIITTEQYEKIKQILSGPRNDEFVEINVTTMEKEVRTNLHNLLKTEFGRKICSTTITKDEDKFIKVSCQFTRGDARAKWEYPEEYTYFILHKENIDTIQATLLIANAMKMKPSNFVYAGTKDKRAKTSQWVCVKKLEPSRIFGSTQRIQNIHVGNFCFKPNTIKLGDLKGNRFRIAVRQLSVEPSVAEESLTSLKENGFINYYGLQRFGNCSTVPTYSVGIQLLKGDFKEACNLILEERDGEPHFMVEMRQIWKQTRDAAQALGKLYSSNNTVEAKILRGLAENKSDFLGALERIPRNMRMLYTHAYQSFLWNQVVSKRVGDFGLQLLEGDLVYKDDVQTPGEVIMEDISEDAEEEVQDDSVEEESRFKTMVKQLTKEDVESGKYTIFDIVMPLPGHDITYPKNSMEQLYTELLEKDGLSSELLKTKQKVYSLGGAYRKVFVKPENFSWSFINYEDADESLILSDIEKFKKDPEPKSSGSKTALILDLFLPLSTYATMALREILKLDPALIVESDKVEIKEAAEEVKTENGGEKRKLEDLPEVESETKKVKVDDVSVEA